MQDDNEVFEKLKKILIETFKLDDSLIKSNASLRDDLGLDSVDLMDAVCLLEDRLQIKILESQTEQFTFPETLQGLVEFVKRKLLEKK